MHISKIFKKLPSIWCNQYPILVKPSTEENTTQERHQISHYQLILTLRIHKKLSVVFKIENIRSNLGLCSGSALRSFFTSPVRKVRSARVSLPPRFSTNAKAYAVGVAPSSNYKNMTNGKTNKLHNNIKMSILGCMAH